VCQDEPRRRRIALAILGFMMVVFAAQGLGVFPASRLGAQDLVMLRGLRLLGRCDDVREEIHAIRSRRGLHHPLVRILVQAEQR